MTDKTRSQRLRERRRQQGFVQKTVFVHRDDMDKFEEMMDGLKKPAPSDWLERTLRGSKQCRST